MGDSTDFYGKQRRLTREEQDAYSAQSHERATQAGKNGLFDDEIVTVSVPQRRGDPITVSDDEGVRAGTTAATLAKLRPAFSADGTVTAGSASQISDGAAAVVVMSRAKAEELGAPILAEIGAHGVVAGPDPSLLSQPSNAILKALKREGRTPADVDLFEINEAFASVALQSMRDLDIDDENVNVNGGAISMGHPVGASGARIALHLALELGRRGGGLGAAGLCGGGGQGEALLLHVPLPDTPTSTEDKRGLRQHGRHDRPGRPGHRRCPRHRAGDQRTAGRAAESRRRGLLARQGRRREVLADHPGASAHQGNIGSAEDCERVIQEVLDSHGRLDILVNNAGITLDKTVRKMTVRGLGPRHPGQPVRRLLPVAGDPAAHARPRIGPHHQHLLGHRRGRQHRPGQLRRVKSGLFGLTMSLAQETARKGITVNSVAPGYISTEMVQAVPKEALDKVIAKIPVGRLGEPDEIARVVEFLADPDSAFITGQIYSVNGGQYM